METKEYAIINKRFDPVNCCIYCGNLSGPFSDEHIIPYALEGQMILPKSSCKKCQKIINKTIEGPVLGEMFGATRIHLGMRTRNPKKRPRKLGIFVKNDLGVERKEVPVQDHPHLQIMPMLPPPAVLERSGGIEQGKARFWLYNYQPNAGERAARLGQDLQLRQPLPVHSFCRLIAKIAHSYSVAILGVDSFKPALLDIILGGDEKVSGFIGGPDETTDFQRDKSLFHQINICNYSRPNGEDKSSIIIVEVSLLSCFDAPIYQAVVGRVV